MFTLNLNDSKLKSIQIIVFLIFKAIFRQSLQCLDGCQTAVRVDVHVKYTYSRDTSIHVFLFIIWTFISHKVKDMFVWSQTEQK